MHPVAAGAAPRSWELADNSGRRVQWAGLRALWSVTSIKRQAYCRRFLAGDFAVIEKRAERASYSGLQTCGLPWTCPCCGPKIAVERAADIALAVTAHVADGGAVALATFTLRHTRAEALQDLLGGLSRAWSNVTDGRRSRALWRAHVGGYIRRLEVTHGANGWHPHLHVLLFIGGDVTDEHLAELGDRAFDGWSASLVRAGLGEPTRERGVDVKRLDLAAAHEEVAKYVAKSAAYEVASARTKVARGTSRTPMALLSDLAADGLASDFALWREYEAATRGRRMIQWSLGLRRRLLADVPELTDEEAAEATDRAGRFIAAIDNETWERVRAWKPGPVALLEVAEATDDDNTARAALDVLLRTNELGVTYGND